MINHQISVSDYAEWMIKWNNGAKCNGLNNWFWIEIELFILTLIETKLNLS